MGRISDICRSTGRFFSSVGELSRWSIRAVLQEDFVNHIPRETRDKPLRVLGNGPSLKGTLERLTDPAYDYFMVNDAPLSASFFDIRPCYLALADEFYFTPEAHEMAKACSRIDWDLTLFIPYQYRRTATDLYGQNPHVRICPWHNNSLEEAFVFRRTAFRLFKRGLSCPVTQNIMIGAIYCGINSGYHEIQLFGAEHSWLQDLVINDKNEVCLINRHYYDHGEPELIPWTKVDDVTIWRLPDLLHTLAKAFESYHQLQAYADWLGDVHIYNYTPGSMIDAFPRKRL